MNLLLPNTIAQKLAAKIVEANEQLIPQKDAIRYGIEWVLITVLQIVLVLLIALPLGLFFEVLTMLIVGSIFRAFSGGAHLSKFLSCLIFSTVQLLLFSYLAKAYLSTFVEFNLLIYALVASSLVIVALYAPILHKKKALFSPEQKRQQKYRSLVVFGLFAVFFSIVFYQTSIMYAAFFALLIQTFSLTHFAHLIYGSIDSMIGRFTERG